MASRTEPPFDAGGYLASGVVFPASTLAPERCLSPEQTRAFEAAARIVERWQRRDQNPG